jgi:hypothetical protein
MREVFKIVPGKFYTDPYTEELVLYYNKQQLCYGIMLAGAILLIYALL